MTVPNVRWPQDFTSLFCHAIPEDILNALLREAAAIAKCDNFWTTQVASHTNSAVQNVHMPVVCAYWRRRRPCVRLQPELHGSKLFPVFMTASSSTGCQKRGLAQSGGCRWQHLSIPAFALLCASTASMYMQQAMKAQSHLASCLASCKHSSPHSRMQDCSLH